MWRSKPLDEDVVNYLSQFLSRVKIKREKIQEGLEESGDQMNADDNRNNRFVGNNEEQDGENNNVMLREERGGENMEVINEGEIQSQAIETVRQKSRIKWTNDLHAKFMKAMEQLGEGWCFPKEIHQIMNVPGLTKKQVASHLQKCRYNNWNVPKVLKNKYRSSSQGFSSGCEQRGKFGRMPPLQTNVPNQIQRGVQFSIPTPNINHIFARGEGSIQQLYHLPHQVQPHYFSNSFLNPLSSIQNNVGSGIQQQDSTMMSGTNVGSSMVNRLGPTNANFQLNVPNNMSDPSNIVAAQDVWYSNDFYLDDLHLTLDDGEDHSLFLESYDLLNEQNDEFDQVFSDDQIHMQVPATQDVQANFPDNQVTTISSAQFQRIINFHDESQHDPSM